MCTSIITLGKIASRLGRKILAPLGIYECQDGAIMLLTAQPDQLQRLIEFMGNPEWAQQELLQKSLYTGSTS